MEPSYTDATMEGHRSLTSLMTCLFDSQISWVGVMPVLGMLCWYGHGPCSGSTLQILFWAIIACRGWNSAPNDDPTGVSDQTCLFS